MLTYYQLLQTFSALVVKFKANSQPSNYKQRNHLQKLTNLSLIMSLTNLRHIHPKVEFSVVVWQSIIDYFRLILA